MIAEIGEAPPPGFAVLPQPKGAEGEIVFLPRRRRGSTPKGGGAVSTSSDLQHSTTFTAKPPVEVSL